MHIGTTADGRLVRVIDNVAHLLDTPADLASALRAGIDLTTLKTGAAAADLRLGAPLVPGKIIGVGLNYRSHAEEVGMPLPENPPLFSKLVSSVTGPTDEIHADREVTNALDFEVELAAVIGRRMRNVSAPEALSYVFGYTVANDVSARDLQRTEPQLVRAKGLDTFCPLGPVVVTADEVGDPQTLRLWSKVNGRIMQDGSTADMVFSVAEILSWCSRHFTLAPGDVVLTGTPAGVGFTQHPPALLTGGDVVEVGIDGIGSLTNPVVEIAAPA